MQARPPACPLEEYMANGVKLPVTGLRRSLVKVARGKRSICMHACFLLGVPGLGVLSLHGNPCTRHTSSYAIFITGAQRSLPSRAMAKVAKRLGANTAQDCDRNTFMITGDARAGRASPTHTSTRLWGIPCVHCRHVPVSLGQSVIFLMKSAACANIKQLARIRAGS
jgi:hypothetical protein